MAITRLLKSLSGAFKLVNNNKDIRRSSIRRLCRDHNIRGVFGPIIELLECEEIFFTAVEVTAGNSLFHVVVETDEISTKIIRYLNSEKGGRVTFIPLNRVKALSVNYPHNSDVVPLVKKLKFSNHHTAAFQQVFGRTVISRDLDVATKVARTNGLDCITLEGDQVSKKGGMTGGFYDHRRSKLKFMDIIRQNMKSIKQKEDKLAEIRSNLEEKLTRVVSDQQKVEAEEGHDKSELAQLDIANANKQKASIFKALEKKEKLITNAHTQIDQLNAGVAMKQAEMGTDLIDHLSSQEKELLSRLNPEITDLKEKLIACRAERIETETRKDELENNLSTNLVRRKKKFTIQSKAKKERDEPKFAIQSDGSYRFSIPQGGISIPRGGYAALITDIDMIEKVVYGTWKDDTSTPEMEIVASYEGIKLLMSTYAGPPGEVTLIIDSTLAADVIFCDDENEKNCFSKLQESEILAAKEMRGMMKLWESQGWAFKRLTKCMIVCDILARKASKVEGTKSNCKIVPNMKELERTLGYLSARDKEKAFKILEDEDKVKLQELIVTGTRRQIGQFLLAADRKFTRTILQS